MGSKIYAAPTEEPVSLAEAKLHLRVDISEDDTLIASLITAARELVEQQSWRALVSQTWDLYLDVIPAEAELKLPRPPLVSVTGVYYTPDGSTEQTLAASNYAVDAVSQPGRIVLKTGGSWPGDTLSIVNGFKVRYVAGYGAASAVPVRYKQAILLLVGHWYAHREAVGTPGAPMALAVEALLAPYRQWSA